RHGRFNGCSRALGVATGPVDQAIGHALVVIKQHLEQMDRRKLLMPLAQRHGLGTLNEAAGPFGIFLDIHATLLISSAAGPEGTQQAAEASIDETPDQQRCSITKGYVGTFALNKSPPSCKFGRQDAHE